MIRWNDDQLAEVGIDRKRLESVVRRMRACAKELDAMGLHVYGADGSGYLVHKSRPEHIGRDSMEADFGAIVADVGLGFEGGGW